MDEGYGLSADGVARCLREYNPNLLIAVDCGTTAIAEISNLKSQGVDPSSSTIMSRPLSCRIAWRS